jgi:hypothetical protein
LAAAVLEAKQHGKNRGCDQRNERLKDSFNVVSPSAAVPQARNLAMKFSEVMPRRAHRFVCCT